MTCLILYLLSERKKTQEWLLRKLTLSVFFLLSSLKHVMSASSHVSREEVSLSVGTGPQWFLSPDVCVWVMLSICIEDYEK